MNISPMRDNSTRDQRKEKMIFDPALSSLFLSRAFSSVAYFSLVFLLAVVLLEPPFSYNATQISFLVGCVALTDRSIEVARVVWTAG